VFPLTVAVCKDTLELRRGTLYCTMAFPTVITEDLRTSTCFKMSYIAERNSNMFMDLCTL